MSEIDIDFNNESRDFYRGLQVGSILQCIARGEAVEVELFDGNRYITEQLCIIYGYTSTYTEIEEGYLFYAFIDPTMKSN
jgi:hypothetical protein